jgi:Sec-independent protein translocase protein TatA
MVEDIGKLAEKYVKEMKKVAAEAEKEFDHAVHEFDRLGKSLYEDVRTGVNDSGNAINNVKDKMMEDLNRELPNMMNDMRRLQERLEHYMQEMQNEIKRNIK